MGYTSDVRCLIYGSKEQVDLLLTTSVIVCQSKILEYFHMSLTRYTTDNHDGVILHVLDLLGEDWKWYESFVDVKAWRDFMTEAEEMGLNYEFIRVGEESDDIEQLTTCDHIGFLYVIEQLTTYDHIGFLYVTVPRIELNLEQGDPIPIL